MTPSSGYEQMENAKVKGIDIKFYLDHQLQIKGHTSGYDKIFAQTVKRRGDRLERKREEPSAAFHFV